MAEVDWLKGFLNRHPNLSIRVAPSLVTNVSYAIAFKMYLRCTNTFLKRAQIWNMDAMRAGSPMYKSLVG